MMIEWTPAVRQKAEAVATLQARIKQLRDEMRDAILSSSGVRIGDQVTYTAHHAGRRVPAQGEVLGAACDDSGPHLLVRRMRKDGTLSKLHDSVIEFDKVQQGDE